MSADRTILLTGGTGTVGRELARRLVAGRSSPRLVVISRSAKPLDPRLPSIARIVRGDLRAPGLGMSRATRDELCREVTDVLHCAADTRFTLPLEEARAANVGATRALLDFAAGCRALKRVGVFSTVYVAGRRTGRIAEADLDDGSAGFVNTYERSKHEMEREVRGRMADLPIAVYRLSTLIGDSRTGAVTTPNAFHHALRLLYHGLAPMVPGRPENRVDVVAVDFVADAACWLFERRFEAGRTYHLCSGETASSTLGELIDATVDSFLRFRPDWRRRHVEKPAIVDPSTYELFVRSVEETGNEVLQRATRSVQSFAGQLSCSKVFETHETDASLEGSGLRPPPVLEYLSRVVHSCLETEWKGAAA